LFDLNNMCVYYLYLHALPNVFEWYSAVLQSHRLCIVWQWQKQFSFSCAGYMSFPLFWISCLLLTLSDFQEKFLVLSVIFYAFHSNWNIKKKNWCHYGYSGIDSFDSYSHENVEQPLKRPKQSEKRYEGQFRENKHTERMECWREDGKIWKRCRQFTLWKLEWVVMITMMLPVCSEFLRFVTTSNDVWFLLLIMKLWILII